MNSQALQRLKELDVMILQMNRRRFRRGLAAPSCPCTCQVCHDGEGHCQQCEAPRLLLRA